MKVAINKTEYFEPYLDANGEVKDSQSTQTNLMVTACLPNRVRKRVLLKAVENADLDNDEVFCLAMEALTGLSKYTEI